MLEDPSRLHEVLASVLDTVTSKVHVASAPAEANSEVVERGERGKSGTLRRDPLLVERVEPDKVHLHRSLLTLKEPC